MTDLITPPGERDLPPAAAARIHAVVTAPHRARRPRAAVLVAAAAAVLLAAVLAVGWSRPAERPVVAMGPAELSPTLHDATEQCLTWAASSGDRVSAADLAVTVARDRRAALMFLTRTGYFACDMRWPLFGEPTGGTVAGRWATPDLLPGPVQPLSIGAAEFWGGDTGVIGRAAARVHRIELDHGDGRSTAARLERGLFGVLADDVTADAELVGYDAAGREVDRRPLFVPSERHRCWAGPSGAVLFPGPPPCGAAEPWGQ